MDDGLLVARLLLAGVFIAAGTAKLVDPAGARRGIAGFGVPAKLTVPLALALPIAELAIAVALLPRQSAWYAAVAALLLLSAFLMAILFNLANGRKPDCRCFGQLRAVPIGASTVTLNVGLLAIAIVCVCYGPGGSIMAAIANLSSLAHAAVVGGLAALIAFTVLVALQWRMLQRLETLQTRIDALERQPAGPAALLPNTGKQEGLPVGTKAPAFSLAAFGGGTVTLDDLLAGGKPVLLVFTDPDCGPCKAMLPDLARRQQDGAITIAVVSSGTAQENQAIGLQGLRHVLLQRKYEISDAYECEGMPGAVIVRPDKTIGSPVAGGNDAILRLLASTAAHDAKPPRIASTIFLRGRGG